MKIKYFIGAAAISAAVLTGTMALAQTPAPANANANNANAPSAASNDWRSTDLVGIPPGGTEQNSNLRGVMMGQAGGYNYGGRGMMNYGASNSYRAGAKAPRANLLTIAAGAFVGIVTILLSWAFMVLGIIALIRHLKTKK